MIISDYFLNSWSLFLLLYCPIHRLSCHSKHISQAEAHSTEDPNNIPWHHASLICSFTALLATCYLWAWHLHKAHLIALHDSKLPEMSFTPFTTGLNEGPREPVFQALFPHLLYLFLPNQDLGICKFNNDCVIIP